MRSKLPTDKLRERIKEYLGKTPAYEIDPNEPAALVRAPVQVGHSRFIDVENIPDLNNLPFVPERLRDFAFRYATEYKPYKQWGAEYGVHPETIEKWLRHEGVKAYVALSRYEQRMYNMAQHVTMQRNVNRVINKLLSETKINGETIGPIVSLAKFVYNALNNPPEASDRAKGVFNLNIGFGQPQADPVRNPYAPERNVTPKDLEQLQSDIEELEILETVLEKSNNGDGDE